MSLLLHGSSTLKWAQTQLCRPSGYGDYLLFVPYSRVLRYHSVNRAQLRREGYIFDNLSAAGLGGYWLPTAHGHTLPDCSGAGYSKAFKFNLSISCSRTAVKTTYLDESVYSKLRLSWLWHTFNLNIILSLLNSTLKSFTSNLSRVTIHRI